MLKKGENGLSSVEAKKRFEEYGPNEISEKKKASAFSILLRQVKSNYIVYLLLAAAILSFIVGGDKAITGYVILVVIAVVVFTGFIQEYRAEKAIEKLKGMVTSVSIVIRDGKEVEVQTKDIVPGDIVTLRNGEKIPADCFVLSSVDLLINEAILTGESAPVRKEAAKDEKNPEKESLIFAGSFVVNGKCVAKVMHTGMNTQFGKIAKMISGAEKDLPLQRKVNTISKYMAAIGIFMAILTAFFSLLQLGVSKEALIDVLILSIAICVSAFPEGFPVVLITTLSVGAHRMAAKNAIVNRMSIIQTLGETTVICSDKTGTITRGEMTVKKVYCDSRGFEVGGVGYSSQGEFLFNKRKVNIDKEKTLSLIQKAVVLCNDSKISRTGEDDNFKVSGNPTEAALLVMASKAGIYKDDFGLERVDEIPFSSERKMMSVVIKEGRKDIVYTKGALDHLLKKCNHIQRDNGVFRLLEKDKKRIQEIAKKMSNDALRTLVIAYKESKSKKREDIEEGLIFLGVVGMEDPPRDGVKEALVTCKKAGISIKMITGDDKITAMSIAKQIDLGEGKVLEGSDLEKLTDDELKRIVKSVIIFARVKPEHKLRIVKALKENGEVVTMTGDGVNDAPALKEAHIGVAMGINGTDVSRSVADLTLKDDNFVTIVDAIKEGRTIFSNIRKFVSYQLSCNFTELMVLFIGVLLVPLLGWPVPVLVALQILLMNLVTSDIPAITLGLNNSSQDIMNDKPKRNAKILNKDFFIVLAISGILMGIFTLGMFYISFNILDQDVATSRTVVLLALIMIEIGGAFNFRSFRKPTIGRSLFVNKYLVYASLISIVVTVFVLYTSLLNRVFETVPLPIFDWVIAIVLTIVFVYMFDVMKKWNIKKNYLKLS